MSFNLKVHHFEQRQGRSVLTKVTPYVRVADSSYGTVYLQNGNAYGEGGPAIKPFPTWVLSHVKAMNPRARAEIGFTDDRIKALEGKTPLAVIEEEQEIPAPREETTEEPIPQRTLTSEEAEAMTFTALKAYAAQFEITSNGKETLIEKLKEDGHIM